MMAIRQGATESALNYTILQNKSVCKIEVHYVGKLGLAFQEYFGLVRKAQIISREFVSRARNI